MTGYIDPPHRLPHWWVVQGQVFQIQKKMVYSWKTRGIRTIPLKRQLKRLSILKWFQVDGNSQQRLLSSDGRDRDWHGEPWHTTPSPNSPTAEANSAVAVNSGRFNGDNVPRPTSPAVQVSPEGPRRLSYVTQKNPLKPLRYEAN